MSGTTAGCTRGSRSSGLVWKSGGEARNASARLEACGTRGSSTIRPGDYRARRTNRKPRSSAVNAFLAIVSLAISALNIDSFAIGFDHRDRERLHALWDEAIDNEQWSDGPLTRAFEAAWAAWNDLPA